MFLSDALPFVLTPITWAFDVMVRIFSVANALPVYLGVFLVGTVTRLFIRKWVGDAFSETKAKNNSKSRPKPKEGNNG